MFLDRQCFICDYFVVTDGTMGRVILGVGQLIELCVILRALLFQARSYDLA